MADDRQQQTARDREGANQPNFWQRGEREKHYRQRDAARDIRRGPLDFRLSPGQTRLARLGYVLLIGILIAMMLASLLGCSAQAQAGDWEPVGDRLSAEQVETVVTTHSSVEPDSDEYGELTSSMVARELEPGLLAIDFNSPLLTGANGTLLVVYRTEDGLKEVFSAYLDRALPPGYDLLLVTERRESDLPCLQINQLLPMEGEVVRRILCFDGNTYQVRDRKPVPVTDS